MAETARGNRATAAALAEGLAAFLYIIGGKRMQQEGFVTFGQRGGFYLTQKGIVLIHNALALMPSPQEPSNG